MSDSALPQWQKLGKDQRALTLGARHFFACRCSASAGWLIEETDNPVAGGGAHIINVIKDHVPTADLMTAIALYLMQERS
jgi:hypothetical protein